MQTLKHRFRTLILLSLALSIALLANFAYSQTWSDPTQAPTGGNAYAPLNASNANQIKGGDPADFGPGEAMITAGIFRAAAPTAAVRAAEYCDYDGNNCFTPSGGGASLPSCSDGEILVSSSGAWECGQANGGTAVSCTMEYKTLSKGCDNQGYVSCSGDWMQYNQQIQYCSNGDPGGGKKYVTYCQRQVCSDDSNNLHNGVHNSYDCLAAGGDVAGIFGETGQFCYIEDSCPSGWTEHSTKNIFGTTYYYCY